MERRRLRGKILDAGYALGKKFVYKDKSCHFKGKFKFKCSNVENLKINIRL
jgi:hypothetical protein